jgi:putative ABC transport system substrate-binding protein
MPVGRTSRRAFIAGLSSAAAWPLVGRAQKSDEVRRVGVLMNRADDDPEGQSRLAAFRQVLRQTGWIDGQNLRIDIRWAADDIERERRYAAELIALMPDALLASGTLSVNALQNVNRSVPIVFVGVTDPVGAGFVDNLARPEANVTGFMIYEYSFGGKRLELLKQIAPNVTRVAVLRDPANAAGGAEFAAMQAVAQSLRVEIKPVDSSRSIGEIERLVTQFAHSRNGGLILLPNASVSIRPDQILTIAAQHALPAVYPFRYLAAAGGLMSVGPDVIDQCRSAASYVDRILRGEKPGDLPVQAPTKYEVVINLRSAKALGLEISPSLLARADEVIE